MSDSVETILHPVIGELRWSPDSYWWEGKHTLASGHVIDVIVDPGDDDRHQFLVTAGKLFPKALAQQAKLLKRAIRDELLELFNDVWRRDLPELKGQELADRLQWELLVINTFVPIEYSYNAGDLFGRHTVVIEVDDEWQVSGVDLQG